MRKLLIISIITLFSSCEIALFESDRASSDPFVNFDYLWEQIDKKYSYFSLKNIDWNLIKDEYRAKLHVDMSDEALFNVLKDMLFELRDDHTNLITPFNVAVYNVESQSQPNFFFRTVYDYYIKEGVYYTGPLIHNFIANNSIGYIRYGSFSDVLTEAHLDFVLHRYASTKGLILDLRNNGGGDMFTVATILSRFVESKVKVGYFRTRNGPKHTDFDKDEEFVISPYDGNYRYTNPVMVLIDRGSYSATTLFALATKALPNVMLVGVPTGGGGGLPNGGQLPNGWTYRFSISQALDLNKKNYAENGVAPDYNVSFDWNDLTKDEILDRAVELIGGN